MTKPFRNDADKRARIEEVRIASFAEKFFEDPALEAWKDEEMRSIMQSLVIADTEQDRLMIQARLIELNTLAATLKTMVQTGQMAKQQLEAAKRHRGAQRKEPVDG